MKIKMCRMAEMLYMVGLCFTRPYRQVDECKDVLLQEMNAPSFRVEKNCDGTMLLHYYSDRSGLCHIVPGETESCLSWSFKPPVFDMMVIASVEGTKTTKLSSIVILGIIGAVAWDFFNSQIDMKIVNQMEEVERTGKKEHVVFLISNNPAFSEKGRSKNAAPSQRSYASGCSARMNEQVHCMLVKKYISFLFLQYHNFGGIINIVVSVHRLVIIIFFH